MLIREAEKKDLSALLTLYAQLHPTGTPDRDEKTEATFHKMLADPDHHVLLAEEDGRTVSSCVCVIVPNLTHDGRPYALIENVVTDAAYRKKGFGTAVLRAAGQIAEKEHCYKLMLLTGAKDEATLNFYERAGFNRKDKTAFIRWL